MRVGMVLLLLLLIPRVSIAAPVLYSYDDGDLAWSMLADGLQLGCVCSSTHTLVSWSTRGQLEGYILWEVHIADIAGESFAEGGRARMEAWLENTNPNADPTFAVIDRVAFWNEPIDHFGTHWDDNHVGRLTVRPYPVPEPSTTGLLVMVVAVLLHRRLRTATGA